MAVPYSVTRINPLDLQGNIAIGVSLPFNGPAVFNSTYSTAVQIKSNMINLMLTNPGERIMNPRFGAGIKKILFEGITDNLPELIKNRIINSTSIYIPEVNIIDVNVEKENNTITVTTQYSLKISGKQDQITVQFI